ncbi:hypothetical protein BGX28_004351 [Mortierella sp. GBA30]|nr:hypothetical protein BGX28_004351 [Mortierella sp. GBA30]
MPDISIHTTKACHDLDELLLRYMTLVDEHLAACQRISSKFQEGRELISQAKYIMGPRNVSAECYDHRMKALRGVDVKGPTDIEIRDLLAERQRLAKEQELELEMEMEQARNSQNNDDRFDPMDDNQNQNRSGLRRRGGGGGLDSGSTSIQSVEDKDIDQEKKEKTGMSVVVTASSSSSSSSSLGSGTEGVTTPTKKKRERNPDPLLWFGVFVPASLRSAQTTFQKSAYKEQKELLLFSEETHACGLQDVVEMAMIRQKLCQLESSIKTLQDRKVAGADA